MPGFTPNYAIEYPCAGEVISPAVFETFADDVDAALAAVDAVSASVLARPRAAIRDSGTSIAFGAMTALSFDSTDFDNGMTAAAAGFTIPSNGLYMIDIECGSTTIPTTVTSWAASILVAGTVVYKRKVSETTTTPPDPMRLNVSGLASGVAGNAVTFQFGWTGTGINLVVTARASISKLCDL